VDQREMRYSAWLLCGQAHGALGQPEDAARAFCQAAQVPVDRRSEALGALSQLYQSRGDRGQAIAALEQARQMDPDNLQYLFNLGVLHLEEKQLDQAAEVFEQVLQRRPDYPPALLNLGYLARIRGQTGQAERFYQRLVQIQPEEVEARANLGHLYLAGERFEEAVAAFQQVRARNPGLLDINLGLLAGLALGGRWDQVLGEEVLRLFPEVEHGEGVSAAAAMVRLGTALVQRRLTQCAELAFRAAVGLDGGCLPARRCLGEVLFHQEAFWQAIAQFEAVVLAQPQDHESFARLGDCYRGLGVEEAARMCYARSGQGDR